ncbi:amidase (plasmid) [Agrobacterium tumefaciens]|uniref:Indoleacetamide hydrolase n=1 Tax=Agrobacterium tumefaciens TaxID=358 RepID=A0AAJ4N8S2_AGRTU|nr:amidase [Agrobacterium tumefaciens]
MYTEFTLEVLCGQIRTGTISALEIREQVLAAVVRHDELNCFIYEGDVDQAFAKPDLGQTHAPLYGIPVSFKDNICVEGLDVTVGTSAMAGCIAPFDATIVERLKTLGAVVAGKNNMHELSFGITSVNPYWGTVGNPTAPGYCAGGSSGGGAAAVAAGIVLMAIGTDTGGSVRIPASFCGIAGFRPTSGRWSSSGIIPVSITKDSPGLLTRTATDALYVFGLVSTAEIFATARPSSSFRIGLPSSLWYGLDLDVMAACLGAIERLKAAGHECVDVDDTAVLSLSRTITFTVPVYEFFLDFPRTLVALGWEDRIDTVFADIHDENVREIISAQLGGRVTPADYASAMANLGRLRRKINQLFDVWGVDLLAYPTVPQGVPQLTTASHPDLFAKCIRNTDLASNAGLPSITIPVAPKGGLPVGLNLDAASGRDRYLLEAASRLEDVVRPRSDAINRHPVSIR